MFRGWNLKFQSSILHNQTGLLSAPNQGSYSNANNGARGTLINVLYLPMCVCVGAFEHKATPAEKRIEWLEKCLVSNFCLINCLLEIFLVAFVPLVRCCTFFKILPPQSDLNESTRSTDVFGNFKGIFIRNIQRRSRSSKKIFRLNSS